MFSRKMTTAAAAIALACSSTLMAADKVDKAEQHFLRGAALDNLTEIQMSEAAQSQAQDPQVKQFAQQMVQDHTQATQQLKQLAKSKDVDLPNDLPKDRREGVDALKSLQGKE